MLPDPPLSRRRFLALTGGVFVLAACGGNGSSGSGGSTLGTDHHAEPTGLTPAVMSGDLYARPQPQRLAFAMRTNAGAFASGAAVTLAVARDPATPTSFQPTVLYTEGLPDKRGIYVSQLVLDEPGVWNAIARAGDEDVPFAIQVDEEAAAPVEGDAAPTAASPTTTDSLGMDPICTRSPECDLHSRSLDTLIGKGRPLAVLFATPARCVSAYCAPVLDALLPLVDEYAERVDVVHCDIYLNNRTQEVSPTVAAWSLPSEPWMFGVDATGTITARLDGAMGQDEMRQMLASLASGQ
jgi:hypothetical protein